MSNREELARDVSDALRDIPDFPEEGVVFKDFTPLLANPELSARVVADVVDRRRGEVDVVVGIEARGFIFGSVMAHQLGVPFIPIRKAGKLPAECFQ
ncbi:phosphoribosyltransferase family protein [Ornithinimicrobium sp. INDO-MA30-4]|uniref:phosphoribosyltransferase family protein n=1 Tax=Ornithinimicrobium sp. INDO-MA30-4 TaxID=2908651 RepID=UPI002882EDDC|nr:phosphoribosyltransferase family protein [Ornithinimicrobium sp. INDO-MA30-4]